MAYSTMYDVFNRFRPAPNLTNALAPYSSPSGFNPIGSAANPTFVSPEAWGRGLLAGGNPAITPVPVSGVAPIGEVAVDIARPAVAPAWPTSAFRMAPWANTPAAIPQFSNQFANPALMEAATAGPDIGAAYAAQQAAQAARQASFAPTVPGFLTGGPTGLAALRSKLGPEVELPGFLKTGGGLEAARAAEGGLLKKGLAGVGGKAGLLKGLGAFAAAKGVQGLGDVITQQAGNQGVGGELGQILSAAGTGGSIVPTPMGALIGGLGAGLGETGIGIANAFTGGKFSDEHGHVADLFKNGGVFANVPFVGQGGEAAPSGPDLSGDALHKKLMAARLDDPTRQAVIQSYNDRMAQRRESGMTPENAALVTYKEFFGATDPQTGEIIPGKIAELEQATPDPQQAIALQALVNSTAQGMRNQSQAALAPYNAAMSSIIPQLPSWLSPIAQASQTQANLDTANQAAAQQAFLMSLPGQLAAQQAQDFQDALARRAQSQAVAAALPNQAAAASGLTALTG